MIELILEIVPMTFLYVPFLCFFYVQGSFLCCGSAVLMVWFGLGTKNTGKGDVLTPQTWLEIIPSSPEE